MISRLIVFPLLAGILSLSGCAHYRLGSGGQVNFTRLYVAPVANEAGLPQASALVSTHLRERFLQDGRLQLVNSPGEAEATLTVTLLDYTREATTARADDTGLARKFDLILSATITLQDHRSQQVLLEGHPLTVRRQTFTDSGQLQAEYQSLPQLAGSLSDLVLHSVLDAW